MDDLDVDAEVTMSPRDADLLNLLALFLTFIAFGFTCLGAPLVLAVPIAATVWYAQRFASREGRKVGLITLVSLFVSLGGGIIAMIVVLTVWTLPLAALGALAGR